MQLPSFFEQLDMQDLLSKFKRGIDQGVYILNPDDDKIWAKPSYDGNPGVNINSPWIYTNNNPDAFCDWWHYVSESCNYIPKQCMHCWKVCARPTQVRQLMLIMKLQHKMDMESRWPRGCKAGADIRPHTSGIYGAYWYNESMEQGLELLIEVRKLMAEEVDPAVPVTLKRGCTEFEMKYGASAEWEKINPPQSIMWDELVDQHCHMEPWTYRQGDLVKTRIMKKWLLHAEEHGDPTVKIFTNGKSLGRPCQSYEPTEIGGGNDEAVVADNLEGKEKEKSNAKQEELSE